LLSWEWARILEYAKIAFTLVFLARFSIEDYRRREVEDPEVYAYVAGSAVFYALSTMIVVLNLPPAYAAVFTALSLTIAPALFTLLHVKGLMGLGDVYVATGLSLSFTYPVLFNETGLPGTPVTAPPIILIILYACASVIIYSIGKALYIAARHRDLLKGLKPAEKILLPVIAKPMTVEEYLGTRFFYPLTIIEEDGGAVKQRVRLSYDVEKEDYREHQARLKTLVEKGVVKPETRIWVSHGIPFLTLILLGFAIFILLGDKPLTMTIQR
jgi:preflagellin peptidase FlaK